MPCKKGKRKKREDYGREEVEASKGVNRAWTRKATYCGVPAERAGSLEQLAQAKVPECDNCLDGTCLLIGSEPSHFEQPP
jgi:hypothetical protein